LRSGKVNIVIGTHRLLQKDIGFKDLGLLIIDEEQRFGVEHKEFIKKMFVGVDILSLSATPIPRTLYLTLSGIRDISILETPPEKRQPIKTILAEFDEGLVKVAIANELNRQGQVYFLNNDIKTLPLLQKKIQSILPEAKIAIAHGKMKKHTLEDKILQFIEQKYDILLCTTIIENGIDIPNVNTIIINNADCFGLAQLHQIRGRVGRSSVRGYAYLLYQPEKVLSTDAEKRLHTLKEFTALGVGYRIALKDLEIRGAGNILGPQQSGYVQSIGFTLYCKILEESVQELKGEKLPAEPSFTLPSAQENYIPADYMEEETLRVSFYRRIMEVRSLTELHLIEAEMIDRFGRIPKATQNLIHNLQAQLNRQTSKVKKVFTHPRFRKK
jgi:transcription-repair coupling factor (superfamily II helicase)